MGIFKKELLLHLYLLKYLTVIFILALMQDVLQKGLLMDILRISNYINISNYERTNNRFKSNNHNGSNVVCNCYNIDSELSAYHRNNSSSLFKHIHSSNHNHYAVVIRHLLGRVDDTITTCRTAININQHKININQQI